MRDFFEILNNEDVYNPDLHNKSDATYQLWGNMVEFISIDQPQKVRGRKRDVLFINEANEINLEDWRQLLLRTTGRVLLDYNPSDEFHWIYEEVIPREDAEFFRTTYKDNPFLPESVVMEIERFKTADENFWKVYGLGERGTSQATIFTHWKEINQIPNEFKAPQHRIGLRIYKRPDSHRPSLYRRTRICSRRTLLRDKTH
jgi:phage terminase large subunit